jgi:hypothetical protein
MPTLSGPLDPIHGPLVRARLLPGPHLGGANRPPQPVDVWALVDTGARHSGVDRRLAAQLGLPQIGAAELRTPASLTENVPVFVVTFLFPGIEPRFTDRQLLGLRLDDHCAGVPIGLLLGRDWMAGKRLHFDGVHAAFELSWNPA